SAGPCEMLSPTLLPATSENKRHAFEAIRKIVPAGATQPVDAVRRGLALHPDVLYLLSDGDFGALHGDVLETVRSRGGVGKQTIVNTILFVYDIRREDEERLRGIADAGGGTYKHVTEEQVGE